MEYLFFTLIAIGLLATAAMPAMLGYGLVTALVTKPDPTAK